MLGILFSFPEMRFLSSVLSFVMLQLLMLKKCGMNIYRTSFLKFESQIVAFKLCYFLLLAVPGTQSKHIAAVSTL